MPEEAGRKSVLVPELREVREPVPSSRPFLVLELVGSRRFVGSWNSKKANVLLEAEKNKNIVVMKFTS